MRLFVALLLLPLAASSDLSQCDDVSSEIRSHPLYASIGGICEDIDGKKIFNVKFCSFPRNNISIVDGEVGKGSGQGQISFNYECLFSSKGQQQSMYSTILSCRIDGKDVPFGGEAKLNGVTYQCIKDGSSVNVVPKVEGDAQSSTDKCEEGSTKASGHLQYKCEKGEYVVIGCNLLQDNGGNQLVAVNKTFDEPGKFRYICQVFAYAASTTYSIYPIACTDLENNLIPVGESKLQSDGSTVSCQTNGDGNVFRSVSITTKHSVGQIIIRNFVMYEVVSNNGVTAEMAVGCAVNKDTTIKIGESIVMNGVQFECKKDGSSISFVSTGCVCKDGKKLAAGESQSRADGATESCTLNKETNTLSFVTKTESGCARPDGKYIRKNEVFTKAISTGGAVVTMANYRCIGEGTYHYLQPLSCEVGQEGSYAVGELVTYEGKTYFCEVNTAGELTVQEMDASSSSCTMGSKTYLHGEEVPDATNSTIYLCDKGDLIKIGCWARGKRFNINSLFYCADEPFYCHTEGTGAEPVGIPGCYVEGKLYHFLHAVRLGNSEYTCSYKGNGVGSYVAVLYPRSCYTDDNVAFGLNTYIKVSDKKWLYCGVNEVTMTIEIRELTQTEQECAQKSDTGSQNGKQKCVESTITTPETETSGGSETVVQLPGIIYTNTTTTTETGNASNGTTIVGGGNGGGDGLGGGSGGQGGEGGVSGEGDGDKHGSGEKATTQVKDLEVTTESTVTKKAGGSSGEGSGSVVTTATVKPGEEPCTELVDRLEENVCKMLAPHCLDSMVENIISQLPDNAMKIEDVIRQLQFIGNGEQVIEYVEKLGVFISGDEIMLPKHVHSLISDVLAIVMQRVGTVTSACQGLMDSCFNGEKPACDNFKMKKCAARATCVERSNCDKCEGDFKPTVNIKVFVKYLCPGTCGVLSITEPELALEALGAASQLGKHHSVCRTDFLKQ